MLCLNVQESYNCHFRSSMDRTNVVITLKFTKLMILSYVSEDGNDGLMVLKIPTVCLNLNSIMIFFTLIIYMEFRKK